MACLLRAGGHTLYAPGDPEFAVVARTSTDAERAVGAGRFRVDAGGVLYALARPELSEEHLVAIGALLRHAACVVRCANRRDGRPPADAGAS